MPDIYLRPYGVASTIDFDLIDVTGANLNEAAVDGGADVTVMLDDGAPATATNDFADEGSAYSLALTAAEHTAARIQLKIQDTSSPKVYLDRCIIIETYGHPLSQHPNIGVPNGPQIIRLELPYGKAAVVNFPLFDFAAHGVQAAATFAAGDVKIGKDEGAEANIGTLPTDRGQTYSMPFTATELTAARVIAIIKDQTSPPLWRDLVLVIETYGHPSAQHKDRGTPTGIFSGMLFGSGSTVSDIVLNAAEADLTNFVDEMAGYILDGAAAGHWFIVHGWVNTGKHVTPLTNLPTAIVPANTDHYVLFSIPKVVSDAALAVVVRAEMDANSAQLAAIVAAPTAQALAEPTSVPAANAPASQKLGYLVLLERNKSTTVDDGAGTVTQTVKADDGTTLVATRVGHTATGVKDEDV